MEDSVRHVSRNTFIAAGLATAGTFAFSTAAHAEPPSDLEALSQRTSAGLARALNERAQLLGLNVTYEKQTASVPADVAAEFNNDADQIRAWLVDTIMPDSVANAVHSGSGLPTITPYGTGNYTASVWSGIPAIGWGYIKQDFRAAIYSGKVASVKMLGSSWASGVTIGTWNPSYSWTKRTSNHTKLEVYMKGSLYYVVKGVTIGGAQTFLDFWKASGSRLVAA